MVGASERKSLAAMRKSFKHRSLEASERKSLAAMRKSFKHPSLEASERKSLAAMRKSFKQPSLEASERKSLASLRKSFKQGARPLMKQHRLPQESSSKVNELSLIFTREYYNTMPKDKNLVFSPLSIQLVLSLIASGCKGADQDHILSFLKQDSVDALNHFFSNFLQTLYYASSSSKKLSLNFVNGTWIDRSLNLKPSFEKIVVDVYKAALTRLDFQNKPEGSRAQVNMWAENETRGLIKEILPPGSVDKGTRVVFGNALYFKGAWENGFNASETKKHKFYLLDGSTVWIPFMTSDNRPFIDVYDGFKVLKLDYADDCGFSMCIYLPDAKDGLHLLVNEVSSKKGFLQVVPSSRVDVGRFLIPKFEISFGFEASHFLKRSGLNLPRMTKIAQGKEVDVNQIYHKSIIQVNEKGTVLAALTGAMDCSSRYPLPPVEKIDFVADHPFLFLIREDRTGVVMFIGTLLNPCVSSS